MMETDHSKKEEGSMSFGNHKPWTLTFWNQMTFWYRFPGFFTRAVFIIFNQHGQGRSLKGSIDSCSRCLSCFFFNWSIVDLQCCISFSCTAKWFSYIFFFNIFFFRFFSHIGYYKILSIVPCALYSRSMLVIYFIYNSVYMLIPNS